MRIVFLGTGAAEAVPGLWCECERCEAARREGGQAPRARTAALIDGRLLIDCGPDLAAATNRLGLSLAPVRTLLITHDHSDHLYTPNLEIRRAGFCATPLPTLSVFGSSSAIGRVRAIEGGEESMALRTTEVAEFTTGTSDGYEFLALRANHAKPPMVPLFYAITDGHSSLLYAHDTGRFPEATLRCLAQPPDGRRWQFDVVSLDATNGTLNKAHSSHMSLAQAGETRRELVDRGLLKSEGTVVVNHFSHNGAPVHSELVELLRDSGLQPACDGLTIDF